MDNPLVSIIIPAYNRADLIGETLESVLAQTYPNWECIVVDDGSTDNTKEVVQQYADKDFRFILVDRPDTHKPGGNGARNYGFEISKGDYIQWFDSDDLMHPVLLEHKIKVLNTNSRLQSVISQVAFFRKNIDDITFITKLNQEHKLYEDVITYQTALYPGSIMLTSKFLKMTSETWDEDLTRAQEFEFFSRLHILFEIPTTIINKPYAFYRQHMNNITNQYVDGVYDKLLSAYNAQVRIISLLIEKNKLSQIIVSHVIKQNKKVIANLLTKSHKELADKYALLNRQILGKENRSLALFIYKLFYYTQKKLPVLNHLLLINKETSIIRLIRINTNRFKKTIRKRGYLKEKLRLS